MNKISRRSVVKGIAAGVPLAAVLADPKRAAAAADSLEMLTIDTPSGRKVTGALAMPDTTPTAAVLLIHEWWGLNDQIKSVARELANQGYAVLALDLYDGEVATTPERAKELSRGLNQENAAETSRAWGQWLLWAVEVKGTHGKVGTGGWCLGGGWSLMASILEPVDATVIYYGKCDRSAEQMAKLKGPVLGHFAKQDKWINADMVAKFEAAMGDAGKTFTTHWYDANHAFANPTGNRYDKGAAAESWDRTTAFLKEHLS